MRLLVLCGSNLRHKYFTNKLIESFDVCGVVCQQRDYDRERKMAGDIELKYKGRDAELMDWHFGLREEKEKEYFGEHSELNLKDDLPVLDVTLGTLNSPETKEFIRQAEPDVIFVYGTGLLKKRLLEVCPEYTINCHAGLSPWYRGAATLFWPLYFLEPEKAGVTFHVIISKIDHGEVLHQCRPEIFSDDTSHDIGCRAIVVAADHAVKLMRKYEENGQLDRFRQRQSGKLFSKRDFRPYHLRVLKWMMDENYLEEYLAEKNAPHRQFEMIEQV